MPPTKPPTPSAVAPITSRHKRSAKLHQQPLEFYNTTSTGHQQGSGVSKPTSWRVHRQGKINQQFRARHPLAPAPAAQNTGSSGSTAAAKTVTSTPADPFAKKRPIFASCSIYISGSTSPTISDHRLKQLLSQNGAHICNIISRKTTTHVIVGNRGVIGAGAGGGLAAGKLQKEIGVRKPGQCGVKYVNVKWATESLSADKRLSEAGYKVVETREGGQRMIAGMLTGK